MDVLKAYRHYIMSSQEDWFELVETGQDEVEIRCKKTKGIVHFYDEGFQACEFTLIHDDEVISYLHFEVNDLSHVQSLYDDFLRHIKKEAFHKQVRVILVCSVGGTTAFFASKLNDAAQYLSLEARFDSDGYMSLYNRANKFDAIFVAPQVRYQYDRIKEEFPDHPVVQIPVDVFSQYDCAQLFFMLHDEGLL